MTADLEPLPRVLECRDLPGTPPLRAPVGAPYLLTLSRQHDVVWLHIPAVSRGRDDEDPADPELDAWVHRHARGARPEYAAGWSFPDGRDALAFFRWVFPHTSLRSRTGREAFQAHCAAMLRAEARVAAEEVVTETAAVLVRLPGDARTWLELARALRTLERFDEAMAAFERASTDPTLRALEDAAGLALFLKRPPADVEALVDRAEAQGGATRVVWSIRAEVLLATGRRSQAVEALARAERHLDRARLLRDLGRLQEAEVACADIIRADGRSSAAVLARLDLAGVQVALGRDDDALVTLDGLLHLGHWYEGFLMRGQVLARLGEPARARADLERCALYAPPALREAACDSLRRMGVEPPPPARAG